MNVVFYSVEYIENSSRVITRVFEDKSTLVEISRLNQFNRPVITAFGRAKFNPIDRYDRALGIELATARAIEKFGRKLARYIESLTETKGQYRRRLEAEKEQRHFGPVERLIRNG